MRTDLVKAFAEVIGDPVAQSKSPLLHRNWLEQVGLNADYFASRVTADELPAFIARRRKDSSWRGCNVTIPHKQHIMGLLDHVDPDAAAIGAVNCVVPRDGSLVGFNTDVDGVAAALDPIRLDGGRAVVIGAGGGARAVVAYLAGRNAGRISLLVRNHEKAQPLRRLAPQSDVEIHDFGQVKAALKDASMIINASSLGMTGAPEMPKQLLEQISMIRGGATLFDLVTTPAETGFLAAGRATNMRTIDGLVMLIGQARRSFSLFFGHAAPTADEQLRDFLATSQANSSRSVRRQPANH